MERDQKLDEESGKSSDGNGTVTCLQLLGSASDLEHSTGGGARSRCS